MWAQGEEGQVRRKVGGTKVSIFLSNVPREGEGAAGPCSQATWAPGEGPIIRWASYAPTLPPMLPALMLALSLREIRSSCVKLCQEGIREDRDSPAPPACLLWASSRRPVWVPFVLASPKRLLVPAAARARPWHLLSLASSFSSIYQEAWSCAPAQRWRLRHSIPSSGLGDSLFKHLRVSSFSLSFSFPALLVVTTVACFTPSPPASHVFN